MTWFQWATSPADTCGAEVLAMDDHWGAIAHTCELVAHHHGDHATELRACIPVATLTWPATADQPAAAGG